MVTLQKPTGGLRHVALFVHALEACRDFYVNLLGMHLVWMPDADNIYLSSGNDNLALHRAPSTFVRAPGQALDHMGFIVNTPEQVDAWHDYLLQHRVKINMSPKTHRDHARSFYCQDPEGNHVQFIYIPGLEIGR